jgi:hypothetical protein
MIDPATSLFKIVELPTVTKLSVPTKGKGKKVTVADYIKISETTYDEASAQISNLVCKTWLSRELLLRDTAD